MIRWYAAAAEEAVRNTERGVRVRTTTTSCDDYDYDDDDDDDDDDRSAPPTRLTRDRPKSQTAHGGGTVAMVTSGSSGGGIEAFALRTPPEVRPVHPPGHLTHIGIYNNGHYI